MVKVNAKRQITLPLDVCHALGIAPGDWLDILAHEGKITIYKKTPGSAAGILKHVQVNTAVDDEASLLDAVSRNNEGHES